jgi:hypothetical protein
LQLHAVVGHASPTDFCFGHGKLTTD